MAISYSTLFKPITVVWQGMSTCNRLDFDTLGPQPILSTNSPHHCARGSGLPSLPLIMTKVCWLADGRRFKWDTFPITYGFVLFQMSNRYVLKELVVNDHSVLPEHSGWGSMLHKVLDGAEIWPHAEWELADLHEADVQAYSYVHASLYTCRVVFHSCHAKDLVGLGYGN